MNRRGVLRSALAAAAVALVGGGLHRARAAMPTSGMAPTAGPLSVTPLAERLFMIQGGGGNVTVFDSPQGVLLVDGGSMERSAEVLRLVRERTGNKKVEVLINTHWHWDQCGSNLALGKAGARIIAHENTRLWLGATVNSKWQQRVFKPLPRVALPTETFYNTGTLAFGGEQIDYGWLPQAHTDGDSSVFFRKANVLVAGDVLAVGSYPILDWCTNGWIGGMANATQALTSFCDADTRVVPGLGPVQSRADLVAEHDMLAVLKTRLSKLLAQGMSVQDMLAAAPTRDFDGRWGDPTLFVSNAWPGLVARARELGVNIV